MPDQFADFQPSLSAPASGGFAVAPSNGVDLPETTRGLYVGEGGDIAVVLLSGQSLVFRDVGGGTLLPIRVTRVLATGTTAAHLLGLV